MSPSNRKANESACPRLICAVMLCFSGAVAAQTDHPRDAAIPLEIGNRRQVFVDRTFLVQSEGVELWVHPPRKTSELTIKPEHEWEKGGIGPYSSVMKIGPMYHMWYHAMDSTEWSTAKEGGAMCLARSNDGIHWEKPDLGLTEYAGSKQNNIVIGHGAAGMKIGQDGAMVFFDPTAPEDQRLRLVSHFGDLGAGIHIFSSADGIHWSPTHKAILTARPEPRGHHLDSQNVIFWDDRLHKYVAYVRKNLSEKGSQGRAVARAESDKLGDFPAVQDMPVVLAPDRSDAFLGGTSVVDYYTSEAIKYPWADNAYYMFPQVYFHYIPDQMREFPKDVPTNAGPLDTQFASSRDGIHWERFGRRPFLSLGMRGEFDWASARMIYGVVPDVAGREMYMYYRASDWLHGWDRDERNKKLLTEAGLGASRNIAVISRVVIRRDGFVSVRAPLTGGEFTTPLMVFKGARLVLNVDTSATGIGRVEIRDEAGEPIDGYRLTDCDLIHTANEINRTVTWHGHSDVQRLAGKPVRLRFALRNADLYAFQFQD